MTNAISDKHNKATNVINVINGQYAGGDNTLNIPKFYISYNSTPIT